VSSPNPYAPTTESFQPEMVGEVLAGRGQRFVAFLIDMVVQIIVTLPLGILLGIATAFLVGDQMTMQIVSNIVGGVLGIIVFMALHGYLLATQGKTIGKLALGIRIVDRDTGQLMPLWPLIGKRYLWQWILGMIPLLNILLIINPLLIFRENRACLHDDIAGTKVIVDPS